MDGVDDCLICIDGVLNSLYDNGGCMGVEFICGFIYEYDGGICN